ncbi:MAG: hypothetical protein JNK38_01385 [Acidobacteria bacterium]|nr:hypothetical protein [Acidobacteriota bacterium]
MLKILKKRSRPIFDDKITIISTDDGRQSVNLDELLGNEEVQRKIAVLRESFMAEHVVGVSAQRVANVEAVEPEPTREAGLLSAER